MCYTAIPVPVLNPCLGTRWTRMVSLELIESVICLKGFGFFLRKIPFKFNQQWSSKMIMSH